jgi:hypothetical protein
MLRSTLKSVFFAVLFAATLHASAQSVVPTWSEQVACIVYTRCTPCHHPGGSAPFSLVDYADAVGASAGMLSAVSNNRMPPWPPDPNYRRFAHERALSASEKQTLVDWLTNNTPQGNPAVAPAPPVYTSTEVIQQPDLSLQMPVYTIPPISSDLYRCFAIPSGNTANSFITGIEVVPGNNSVVHHVLVYADTTGVPLQLDAQDPAPGYNGFGGVGSNSAQLIGSWVPGSQPDFYPNGMGIRLPANATIILQVHYPVGSSFQQDSTKINLLLTTNPLTRNVYIAPALNHSTSLTNGPLFIPADSVKTFYAQAPVSFPVTLLAIFPHMHLIGRSIRSWAITSTGTNIPLIDIPNWNFMWQGGYFFRQPIKIPANSVLHSEATYDNTPNNPYNPNNPPVNVSLGEATTDEMMLVYFSFLVYQPGDENIIIDTSTVVNTYNGCNFVTSTPAESGGRELPHVYPNPSGGQFQVAWYSGERYAIRITDALGREVYQQSEINGVLNAELHSLPEGQYWIHASNEHSTHVLPLLIAR